MRLLVFIFLLVMAPFIYAEDGSNVVVLYNSMMPASKAVADHYAKMRAVPAEQVIGLPMSAKEAITRDEFRNELEEPFLQKLEELKLLSFGPHTRTNAAGKEEQIRAVTQ